MALNTTQVETVLPEWYTQYAKDILSKATAATAQPYTPYAAPRIAGFQPEQEQAFSAYKQNMGSYQPYLSAAAQGLQRGTGSFTAPGVSSQYMNPYTQSVVSGIGSAAARNLTENILPQLNRTFVGGGTFGGSRSQEFMNRAVRDTQAAALAEQNKALNTGYESAQGQYNAEANRNVTAAPYMASLGTQMQEQQNKDLAGLEQIGSARQGLAQQSADLAYQDFLNQQNYPYSQVQKLAAIGGAPSAGGSGTQSTTAPGPSTLGQIAGGLGTAAGIIGATGGFGSGGWLTSLFKAEGGEIDIKKAKKAKKAKAGLGWLKD
jgi:hypothetical protein